MRLDNSPKAIVEEFIQKHSQERIRISDSLKKALERYGRWAMWLVYQPYKWFFLAPFLAGSTFFFSVLVLCSSLFSQRFARYFAVAWARVNSFFTPMAVTVEGRNHMDPDQSYVIVANHQSLYDIYVLYGWLGVDFKWVMKKELEKVPALGSACKALGHIFIDRSNTEAALESINTAKSKITGGTSVVFFPEGSRSSDGKVGAFKKGAFKMALDLGLPILPVTLVGTRAVLPKGSVNLMPGTAKMIVHPPVSLEGYSEKNMKKLIVKTRSTIISGLHGKRP